MWCPPADLDVMLDDAVDICFFWMVYVNPLIRLHMDTKTITIAGREVSLLNMVAGIFFSCVVLKAVHEQYQSYVERERSSDELQVEITSIFFDTIRQSMSKSAKVNDLEALIMKRHADVLRVERMTFIDNQKEDNLMKKDHTLDEYARNMYLVVIADVIKVATLRVYFIHYYIYQEIEISDLTIRPNRDDTVDAIYDQVETHMQQSGVDDAVNLEVDEQVLPRGQLLVDACDMSNFSVIVYVVPKKISVVVTRGGREFGTFSISARTAIDELTKLVCNGNNPTTATYKNQASVDTNLPRDTATTIGSLNMDPLHVTFNCASTQTADHNSLAYDLTQQGTAQHVRDIKLGMYVDAFWNADASTVTLNTTPSDLDTYAAKTIMMKKDMLLGTIAYAQRVPDNIGLSLTDKFNIALYTSPNTFHKLRPIWNTLMNIHDVNNLRNNYLIHIRDLFLPTARKLKAVSFENISELMWLSTVGPRLPPQDSPTNARRCVYRQMQFNTVVTVTNKTYTFRTHDNVDVKLDFENTEHLLGQAPFVSFSKSSDYVLHFSRAPTTENVLVVYRLCRHIAVDATKSCIKDIPRALMGDTVAADAEAEAWCVQPSDTILKFLDVTRWDHNGKTTIGVTIEEQNQPAP